MKTVLFVQGGGPGAHRADAELVAQLKASLGAGYDVLYPKLTREKDPDFERWGVELLRAMKGRRNLTLVGHSLGGATLLNLLTRQTVRRSFAGLHLLAAPARDANAWDFDDLQMPRDAERRLGNVSGLRFYHCQDDDTVPVSHLALHRRHFPRASFRRFSRGGHQFEGHMHEVAQAIVSLRRSAA